MWPYENEDLALRDVLRLSRGMTYKAAICELPYGGGKSVIIDDAKVAKTPAMLRAAGRLVEGLGGRYIIADDVGTSLADLAVMREVQSTSRPPRPPPRNPWRSRRMAYGKPCRRPSARSWTVAI